MTTCETCQHWYSGHHYHSEEPQRKCHAIPHRETLLSEHLKSLDFDDWHSELRAQHNLLAETPAYVTDASGYHAAFYTTPNFGCVLHQPRMVQS